MKTEPSYTFQHKKVEDRSGVKRVPIKDVDPCYYRTLFKYLGTFATTPDI